MVPWGTGFIFPSGGYGLPPHDVFGVFSLYMRRNGFFFVVIRVTMGLVGILIRGWMTASL